MLPCVGIVWAETEWSRTEGTVVLLIFVSRSKWQAFEVLSCCCGGGFERRAGGEFNEWDEMQMVSTRLLLMEENTLGWRARSEARARFRWSRWSAAYTALVWWKSSARLLRLPCAYGLIR